MSISMGGTLEPMGHGTWVGAALSDSASTVNVTKFSIRALDVPLTRAHVGASRAQPDSYTDATGVGVRMKVPCQTEQTRTS